MPKKRLNFSSFLLTINQNKSFDKGDVKNLRKASKKLRNFIDNVLNEGNLKNIIKINKKEDKEKNLKEIIRDINIYKALEYGDQKQKLHAHIYFIINHYSNIRLDNERIRKELKSEMDSNIYYNNTLIRSKEDGEQILNYITKHNKIPNKFKWLFF